MNGIELFDHLVAVLVDLFHARLVQAALLGITWALYLKICFEAGALRAERQAQRVISASEEGPQDHLYTAEPTYWYGFWSGCLALSIGVTTLIVGCLIYWATAPTWPTPGGMTLLALICYLTYQGYRYSFRKRREAWQWFVHLKEAAERFERFMSGEPLEITTDTGRPFDLATGKVVHDMRRQ